MNAAFMRRLEVLEKRLISIKLGEQPARETELARSLLERLESGRRRVAEARERRALPPWVEVEPGDTKTEHRTIVEILHAGRQRCAVAHQVLVEARRPRPETIAGLA